MRKVSDLMKDLGFREDASEEVKIAFVKNLARAAYGVELESPRKRDKKSKARPPQSGEQLSFSFDPPEPMDPVRALFPKRRSG